MIIENIMKSSFYLTYFTIFNIYYNIKAMFIQLEKNRPLKDIIIIENSSNRGGNILYLYCIFIRIKLIQLHQSVTLIGQLLHQLCLFLL